ncbi:RNA 2',3'-cyclic phosphodiesterase [Candidatus Woesearchaeota archaeon]|nr:RNA 2',3'-cyclic phosphodiesterase [Candidatus Woesearchaeota archaeon]
MRLFVAIDVPDSVKEHLAFLQRSLDRQELRLIQPKNIHLTLNFLGERPSAEPVIDRLSTIDFSPFTLRLSGAGFFPSPENPRVLWVGLEDDEGLFSLQRKIDELFTPEKSFRAHLTLARVKRAQEQERLRLLAEVARLRVKQLSFPVRAFKLYKSTLTALGPVYEALETFKATE